MVALPCKGCVGRALNICKPLDEERLARLLSLGGPRCWRKGETLFRAGDPMGPFFKIRKGVAAVSRAFNDGRRQIVALRVPGDCLGYLEQDNRYVFDGHALTDVDACTFDRRRYDAYAAEHPDLAAATMDALATSMRQAGRALFVLGQLTATERVAHFLVEIDELYRERQLATEPLSLFMNRTYIGDYLGLRQETVCRAFGKLKKRGLIEPLGNDQVVILDRAKLRELGKA
jgi:CRP/FNR family transcriptional regulator, anaerobic regulatory protein